MPGGQRHPDLIDRDRRLMNRYLAGGTTMQQLADEEGISKQRVYQIVSKLAGRDIPEDVTRDIHVLRLESLIAEFMGIALGPPGYKISPTGKLVYDENDEPVRETVEKKNAADLVMRLDESLRKLYARDLPRQKEMEFTAAQQEALAWIERFKDSVVDGEIVPPPELERLPFQFGDKSHVPHSFRIRVRMRQNIGDSHQRLPDIGVVIDERCCHGEFFAFRSFFPPGLIMNADVHLYSPFGFRSVTIPRISMGTYTPIFESTIAVRISFAGHPWTGELASCIHPFMSSGPSSARNDCAARENGLAGVSSMGFPSPAAGFAAS